MILPTGNNSRTQQGFSFIEVMVTLVVLSSGIVLIYQSFFLSVDYLNRLAARQSATALIDEKIADIRLYAQQQRRLDFDHGPSTMTIVDQQRPMNFLFEATSQPYGQWAGLYQLNVRLSWIDRRHRMSIERQAIIQVPSWEQGK